MSGVTTAALLVGAAVAAYATYSQGQQQSKIASANANIASQNAAINNQNAIVAENQGAAAGAAQELKARQANSTLRASAGSNGLDVNSGTVGALQDQNTSMGEFNALTSRNNAAREAWGYQVQATNSTNQANIDQFSSKSDAMNGYLGAGAQLITGAGSAGSNYIKLTGK